MKKLICALAAVLGFAPCVVAGIIYWTVNDGATVTDVTANGTGASAYSNWNIAKLSQYESIVQTSDTTTIGNAVSSTPAASSGSTGYTAYGKEQATTTTFAFNPTPIETYSSGVFYIELFNGSQLVGRSGDYLTYNSTSQTFENSAGKDFMSTSTFMQDVSKVWNGGGTYYAVPEPTSGVMLLLGAALLGLRRRKLA